MTGWLDGPGGERLRLADEKLRRALADVEALGADVGRRLQADGTRRAEAARKGELGPDWQRVQERIDAGRTTLADVVGGADASPEAERLRGQVRETLAEARHEAEEAGDSPFAEVQAQLQEVRARMDELVRQAAAGDVARPGQPGQHGSHGQYGSYGEHGSNGEHGSPGQHGSGRPTP